MPVLEGFPTPIGAAIAPGGAAATDLGPIPGINLADTLINVRHVSGDLVTNADVTAEASITDADTIQLTTTVTTGDFVIVVWKEAE